MVELLELVLGDGIVKCNDPLSQFPVKRDVWISLLSVYDDNMRLISATKALQQNLT